MGVDGTKTFTPGKKVMNAAYNHFFLIPSLFPVPFLESILFLLFGILGMIDGYSKEKLLFLNFLSSCKLRSMSRKLPVRYTEQVIHVRRIFRDR